MHLATVFTKKNSGKTKKSQIEFYYLKKIGKKEWENGRLIKTLPKFSSPTAKFSHFKISFCKFDMLREQRVFLCTKDSTRISNNMLILAFALK